MGRASAPGPGPCQGWMRWLRAVRARRRPGTMRAPRARRSIAGGANSPEPAAAAVVAVDEGDHCPWALPETRRESIPQTGHGLWVIEDGIRPGPWLQLDHRADELLGHAPRRAQELSPPERGGVDDMGDGAVGGLLVLVD